jgi:hypothetical protein
MLYICLLKKGGVFEAETKRKLTASMIEHYIERDCEPEQIQSIFCIFKNEKTKEFCQKVVAKIQEIVDEGVAEGRKISDYEYCERIEIQNDYYSNLI